MTKRSVGFFGDELMLGLRDPEGFGWPQRLTRAERAHGHALVPYILGVEGDTTLDVAARWRSESEARLAGLPTSTLVFCIGVNDQASSPDGVQVSLPDSLYAAETMIADAASWRAVFWISPPPVLPTAIPQAGRANQSLGYDPVRVRGLAQGFAAIAARCGVPFLDLTTLLDAKSGYAKSLAQGTGILPGADGQALIANAVETWKPWRDWLDKSTAPNLYFAPS